MLLFFHVKRKCCLDEWANCHKLIAFDLINVKLKIDFNSFSKSKRITKRHKNHWAISLTFHPTLSFIFSPLAINITSAAISCGCQSHAIIKRSKFNEKLCYGNRLAISSFTLSNLSCESVLLHAKNWIWNIWTDVYSI